MKLKHTLLAAVTATMMMSTVLSAATAAEHTAPGMKTTWERTDRPVAEGAASRTWMWGPEANTAVIWEDYADSPGGKRQVQYFDKSRMEITNPYGDPSSPWRVTNGLLVVEMSTGNLQTGDDNFTRRAPASIPVAGDAINTTAPTYATIGKLTEKPALTVGATIVQRLGADGMVTDDPALADLGVTAGHYVPETSHTIANVFWTFMHSSGPVYEDSTLVQRDLFLNPFYATGLPLTEAYWSLLSVGGQEREVLVQAFERRVLTYTPGNPAGWQVESGNVGQHYHSWRYGAGQELPRENTVIASIPTGPETLEYRYKGNPPIEAFEDGPSAISAAPDGTFWIADVYGSRLSQFSRDGQRLNTIELEEQGAQVLNDIEVDRELIWVSWANLNYGIFKLQAYTADGVIVTDIDVPEAVWSGDGYLGHELTITDDGEVVFGVDLSLRYVRVLDAGGNISVTELPSLLLGGHSYAVKPIDMTRTAIEIDGRMAVIIANDSKDAFAQSVFILPDPVGGTFFVEHTLVFNDPAKPHLYLVYHYSIDGELLGTSTTPLHDSFTHVRHRNTVGPDGHPYMLATYQHHMEIMQFGFEAPK